MRLLWCHIENFGKWTGKDIDFTSGINEFFMSNGEGKTTLACFIKAMLYGLKGYTESTKDFVDRRHYAPFGSGTFGGSLRIEIDGDEYRIERRFDKKSAKRDELTVYKNNTLTDGLADPIGLKLFGLDEDSFARTLFVTAEDMELCATEGISGSLNGYVDNKVDVKRSLELLDSAIKKYKKRGKSSGLIGESEERIREYRRKIENLERTDKILEEKYKTRSSLVLNIEELEKKASEAREAELLAQKWQSYDALISSAKEYEEKLSGINEKYPRGIPSAEAIADAERTLDDFYRASERLSAASIGEENQKRLSELDALFANAEPAEKIISDIQASIDNANEKEARIKALEMRAPSERERDIIRCFEGRAPSDSELERIEALADGYRQKSAELLKLGTVSETAESEDKAHGTGKLLPSAVALIGAAVSAIGAALIFAVSFVVGIIAILIGAGILVGAVFVRLFARMNDMEKRAPSISGDIVSIQLDMRVAESELRAAILPYGYDCADGALGGYTSFKGDVLRYRELAESERERAKNIETLSAERYEITEQAKQRLLEFGYSDSDVERAFERLKSEAREWKILVGEKKDREKAKKDDTELLCALNEKLDAFFASYGEGMPDFPKDELERLKNDSFGFRQYTDALNKAGHDASEYMKKEKLSERPSGDAPDARELEEAISEKRKELLLLDNQITDDEDDLARLDVSRALLETETEKLEEYKNRHRLLSDCKTFLETSDARLTAQYVTPVRDSFVYYANAVREAFGNNMELDRELRVSFQENGYMRGFEYLSTGQRAVWALCLRLAFTERIFDGKAPFVLLDDPFVSLDGENMRGVARLLKRLSEDRQIIYLTCHESRRI